MQESLIKSSFKYCEDLTKKHYENFPVASFLIPKDKRKYIYAVYAFARAADDFADEPGIEGGREKRLALIDEWNAKLNDCYSGKAYDPIFIALGETVKDCKIPKELLENLLNAFRQDIVKSRYKNFNEVLGYCKNSANPVGRLVLTVFDIQGDELFNNSDKICTALQLANFWQDVKVDLKKDRIYIPRDDMKKYGVNEDDLLNSKNSSAFRDLIKFQAERTEKLFEEGKELFELLKNESKSKRLILELKLTWLGGKEILNKIKAIDYDVLKTRPKLNLFDKLKLIMKTII
jgi:squalene synthase HpnC